MPRRHASRPRTPAARGRRSRPARSCRCRPPRRSSRRRAPSASAVGGGQCWLLRRHQPRRARGATARRRRRCSASAACARAARSRLRCCDSSISRSSAKIFICPSRMLAVNALSFGLKLRAMPQKYQIDVSVSGRDEVDHDRRRLDLRRRLVAAAAGECDADLDHHVARRREAADLPAIDRLVVGQVVAAQRHAARTAAR